MKPEYEEKEIVTCTICGKKPGIYQCDFPKRYLHIRIERRTLRETVETTHLQTCDRYVCEDCALSMGDGIHVCTNCYTNMAVKARRVR